MRRRWREYRVAVRDVVNRHDGDFGPMDLTLIVEQWVLGSGEQLEKLLKGKTTDDVPGHLLRLFAELRVGHGDRCGG